MLLYRNTFPNMWRLSNKLWTPKKLWQKLREKQICMETGVSVKGYTVHVLHCFAVSLEQRTAVLLAYAVAVSPNWCLPGYAVSSLLPLVTQKVNCSRSPEKRQKSLRPSFKGHVYSTESVCGSITSSLGTALGRTFTIAVRWPACQSVSQCGAGKRVRLIRYEQAGRQTDRATLTRCVHQELQFCRSSNTDNVFQQATER